jgi:hypothetical protein
MTTTLAASFRGQPLVYGGTALKVRRFRGRQDLVSKKRVLGLVGLVGALFVLSGCFPAPSQPPKVILYGDSLSLEAWGAFRAVIEDHGRAVAERRAVGGSGICDFFDEMEADKDQVLPTIVVLAFVGNTQPACINGLTGAAALEKYRQDAQHAIDIWKPRGVHVYLVGTPPRVGPSGSTPESPDQNREMYFPLAIENGVNYIDAGHSVFNHQNGFYQFHLPCLPDEGPQHGCGAGGLAGLIQVRAPDGLHFCPTWNGNPEGGCSVYASGARRFGFDMAAPIVTNHGL